MDDFKILIGGGFAGLAQVLAGYPFDTVKVRYVGNNYTSIISCIKDVKRNGYKYFYRGVTSPMLGSVIMNIQTFYLYSLSKRYISHDPIISGAISGFVLGFVESPVDLIKSRLQTDSTLTYKRVIKDIGLDGIYKGLGITLLRNTVSVGLFFGGYEYTKRLFDNEYIGSFVGGSIAGFCCWGPNYPFDNIKIRLQTDTTNKYKGIVDCFRKVPLRNLWKGFLPCIIRAMVVNPFVFLAYEAGVKHLD